MLLAWILFLLIIYWECYYLVTRYATSLLSYAHAVPSLDLWVTSYTLSHHMGLLWGYTVMLSPIEICACINIAGELLTHITISWFNNLILLTWYSIMTRVSVSSITSKPPMHEFITWSFVYYLPHLVSTSVYWFILLFWLWLAEGGKSAIEKKLID